MDGVFAPKFQILHQTFKSSSNKKKRLAMTKLPLQQLIHFQAGGHKVSILACPLLFSDVFSENHSGKQFFLAKLW